MGAFLDAGIQGHAAPWLGSRGHAEWGCLLCSRGFPVLLRVSIWTLPQHLLYSGCSSPPGHSEDYGQDFPQSLCALCFLELLLKDPSATIKFLFLISNMFLSFVTFGPPPVPFLHPRNTAQRRDRLWWRHQMAVCSQPRQALNGQFVVIV